MAETETRFRMAVVAVRLMNGTAGGLPRRKVDLHDCGAYSAVLDAWLAFRGANPEAATA